MTVVWTGSVVLGESVVVEVAAVLVVVMTMAVVGDTSESALAQATVRNRTADRAYRTAPIMSLQRIRRSVGSGFLVANGGDSCACQSVMHAPAPVQDWNDDGGQQ